MLAGGVHRKKQMVLCQREKIKSRKTKTKIEIERRGNR